MYHVAARILQGKASPHEIDLLDDVGRAIGGKCLCALGEFSIMAVNSGIEHFREDFAAHIKDGR
jgi:NADH-quinone oxidoreductase subunit F